MLPYRMRFAPQVTWKSWKKCAPEDRRHLSRSRSAATSHECHLLSRHTVYLSNTLYIARTKIFQVLIHSKLEMMENSGSANLSVPLSVRWLVASCSRRSHFPFLSARATKRVAADGVVPVITSVSRRSEARRAVGWELGLALARTTSPLAGLIYFNCNRSAGLS